MHEQQFTHHPLLVLSNFGLQQIHIKLMASMFQNMFPSINVHKVNLNSIKRCLLIRYDARRDAAPGLAALVSAARPSPRGRERAPCVAVTRTRLLMSP
nr:PREDICTED: suppressor of SWI4 1 homolog [Struthio camelus australis]